MAPTVSVVTPVYNEADCVREYCKRTVAALERLHTGGFELVFVDDGSTDETPRLLSELSRKDSRIKVLTLSRNFGHHPAVFAGLSFARGQSIVILDADLQDPPELIAQLLGKQAEGFELIFARRRSQPDGIILGALKRVFRRLMRRLANIEFPDNIGVFSVMDAKLRDLLIQMPERERYLVAMQLFLGFRVGFVDYDRQPRHGGSSKQSLGRLFRLGMNSLFSYSRLPLQFALAGGLCCLAALMVGITIVLYHKFVLRVAMTGWTSVMLTILLMAAVQLLSLWLIGEYVDRIFENTKSRPYYIIWKQQGTAGIGG